MIITSAKCKGCGKDYFPRHAKDYRCEECYAKLGKRSKRKGNANELRFAKYLNEQFKKYKFPYVARRTPRSGGIQEFEPSDIIFKFLPGQSVFARQHFENKNTAQWDIQGWYDGAKTKERETGRNRNPILIIRRPNSHEEFAVMSMEYLVELLLNLEKFLTENGNNNR